MTITNCSIDNLVWSTPDIMELTCTPFETYNFKAGQYAFLQTKDMPEPRAYSIATPEDNETLTFHIRKVENSPTSQSFMKLKQNDNISISPPQGNNILDKSKTSPLVFIAGGVGIAPLYAMIMTAHKLQPTRKIILYWGGDTKADLYLHDNLIRLTKEKMDFTYTPVCLEQNLDIKTGLVTDHIDNSSDILHTASIHIAGPKPMMQHTLKILDKHGIHETSISYDKFW